MPFDFSQLGGMLSSTPINNGKTFAETDLGGFASSVMSEVKTGNKAGYDSGGFGATMTVAKMVPVYGQALAIVEGIIGKATINRTLGAVFAKGGGFQCWGATWTPARAERDLPNAWAQLEGLAKKALNVTPDQLQASINQYFEISTKLQISGGSNLEHDRHWLMTSAKDCTKKGLEKWIKGIDSFQDKVKESFKKAAEASGYSLITGPTRTIQLNRPKQKPIDFAIPTFMVNGNGSTVKKFMADGTPVQTAGGGTGTVLMVAAAAGMLLFGKKIFK